MNSIISLHHITKVFKRGSEEVRALDGASLEIHPGDYTAICGPSGSGKTTLLNIAGCMDHPSSGTVFVRGNEVEQSGEYELSEIRSATIGFVFQQFFLIPTLTVLENVALPLIFSRRKMDTDKTAALLESVGLGHRLTHFPGQLSGGEMQRVAVARALVNEPAVLLADEPTGNLDSRNSAAVIELFEELNNRGIAVVMVTHNLDLAARCRKVIRIEDGKIVA
jgi:ABC-type lipoprotein export system ATPase subunit